MLLLPGSSDGRLLTLVDRRVGHLLRVVDAAEQLMGLSIIGLRCKRLLQCSACLIDPALLQKRVGLGVVGKQANAGEKNKKKRNPDADQV